MTLALPLISKSQLPLDPARNLPTRNPPSRNPRLRSAAGLLGLVASLLVGMSFAGADPAQAIGFAPGAPFGSDDGTALFVPTFHPDPECNCTRITEIGDFSAGLDHEWGFYFADDPNNLIPLFDENDDVGQNIVGVHFDNGTVYDSDLGIAEQNFTPSLEAFGFYLLVNYGPRGNGTSLLLFSDPARNAGNIDYAGTFPTLFSNKIYLIAFEVNQVVLALELVDNVLPSTPVPEPTTALLLVGGIALAASARRRSIRAR